jgi:hypothetical protein
MNKYIIHGQSFSGNVTLEYDCNDRLKLILFECEMNDKQHEQFVRAIPLSEADFLNRATRSGVIFSTVPADLSFATFWQKYNYKVGDKARAEKLWNKLSESERVTALKSILHYNKFLQIKKLDKAYAETWLSQKRFLTNEY